MMVFSFYDPDDPFLAIDLFVDYPVDFAQLLARSDLKSIGGASVRVCGRDDLIAMSDKEQRDKGFQAHAMEQAVRIARATTFEQRFRWLERTIDLLRPQLRENFERQRRLGSVQEEIRRFHG
jgi:hypothetical protein